MTKVEVIGTLGLPDNVSVTSRKCPHSLPPQRRGDRTLLRAKKGGTLVLASTEDGQRNGIVLVKRESPAN